MVKKYGDLYLSARKALRPGYGENAGVYARELLALASGKSVAALLSDRELYASEAIEEKLNDYLGRAFPAVCLAMYTIIHIIFLCQCSSQLDLDCLQTLFGYHILFDAICPHAPPPLHVLSCGTAGGPVQRQPV